MAEKYPRNEKPCCSKLGHQNWMQEEEKTETKGKSAKVPFLNYCDQTSLHGWTYLSTEVGLFRKGLWASLVCVSVIVSLFYTHANILEFMNATTITSINTTAAPLSDVYFPATVICNINQASKAFLNTLELYSAPEATVLFNEFAQGNVSGWKQYGRYGKANPELNTTKYKDILTKTLKTLEKKYNYTQTTSFTSLAAPKCEDIMVYAHFKDTESRLFYKAYRSSTDYGVCCLVVPYLDFENPETRNVSPNDYTGENFLNVPRGAGIGARNGLKLILDIESFDYAFHVRGGTGLKVALIDHRDKAVIKQDGFYVSPGKENSIALVPSILNTTERAMSSLTPEERDCYTDQEFQFKDLRPKNGYRYHIKTCMYQALITKVVDNCGCKPGFIHTSMKTTPYCQGESLGCYEYWMGQFGNESNSDLTWARDGSDNLKKCRQRCEYQSQEMIVTTTNYPNKLTLPLRKDFCYILKKISNICKKTERKKVMEKMYERHGSNLCELVTSSLDEGICTDQNLPGRAKNKSYERVDNLVLDYAQDNLSVVKLFIKNPYYTSIKRDLAMTQLDFIGNAGGLLGLCMGMSFISMFEIIYHCCNFAFHKIQVHVVPQ